MYIKLIITLIYLVDLWNRCFGEEEKLEIKELIGTTQSPNGVESIGIVLELSEEAAIELEESVEITDVHAAELNDIGATGDFEEADNEIETGAFKTEKLDQ